MMVRTSTTGSLIVSALLSNCVHAAEWRIEPMGQLSAQVVQNPQLVARDTTNSVGTLLNFSSTMTASTERSAWTMTPRVTSSHYTDASSLSSTDGYLDFSGTWISERTQWTSSVNLVRDTTLTSELGLTGLVQGNRPHEGVSAGISPLLQLTERLSAGAQVYYSENHYVDTAFTGLVDYNYLSTGLNAEWATTPNLQATANLSYGVLSAPDADQRTRSESIQIGLKYKLAENWSANISAGPSRVQADAGSDSGWVLSSDLKHHDERTDWSLQVGRELTPTGRGLLSRRDQITFGFSRRMTEHLVGEAYVTAVNSQALSPGQRAEFEVVRYQQLEGRLNWLLSPVWSLSFSATSQHQTLSTSGEPARGYRALLGIVWKAQPHIL